MQAIEPTINPVDSPVSDTVQTHPAYGQIRANRVSGQAILYGSDFVHHHFITITISESELHRGFSSDKEYAKQELIEVSLSEAQWATFISSINCGMGVPCTLEHVARERKPRIAGIANRKKQYADEHAETLKDAIGHIEELALMVNASKLSVKAKEALAGRARMAIQEIACNLGFVEKQFEEHMEKNVEKAKVEVNAYVTGTIARAGLAAIAGNTELLQLAMEGK